MNFSKLPGGMYMHLPYTKARFLEVCDLEKPSLGVGKMHVHDVYRPVV